MPADPPALLVENADDPVGCARLASNGPDKCLGLVARAHEQHRDSGLRSRVRGQFEVPVLEEPIDEPRSAEQRHQHEPVDHGQRAREELGAGDDEQDEGEDQHGESDRLGDLNQVVHRRVAPDALVEPHGQEDRRRDNGEERRALDDELGRDRFDGRPHAQPQRQWQRYRRHEDVVRVGDIRATRSENSAHERAPLDRPLIPLRGLGPRALQAPGAGKTLNVRPRRRAPRTSAGEA